MKESGVLGDIVPNNTNPAAGAATAVRPSAVPVTSLASANGFGASSFTGASQGVQPGQAPRPLQGQPSTLAQPSTVSQPQTDLLTTNESSMPVIAAADGSNQSGNKLPLILTIVGVVIFIGGVAGLFIYALGG